MKKLKINSQLAALLTAGTILLTMSGCSNKNPGQTKIGGTLEGTVVSEVDGDPALLRPRNSALYTNSDYTESLNGGWEMAGNMPHIHYYDVLAHNWITDCDDCYNTEVLKVDHIETYGSIVNYLTKEELQKYQDKSLTSADLSNIYFRISIKLGQAQAFAKTTSVSHNEILIRHP